MAENLELFVTAADGTRIPVRVARKRVKNLNLRVRSDGTVVMSAPLRCPLSVIERTLAKRAAWIDAHVQARRASLPTPTGNAAPFVPPLTIPLWGTSVNTVETLGIAVRNITSAEESLTQEQFARAIQDLYAREIKQALPPVAKRFECALGVHASRWSIRHMKTRWGSCTPKTGAIRITAGLAAYPPVCLELVVAHELVHLIEPSHNARFHALLDQLIPDNRARMALLKRPT